MNTIQVILEWQNLKSKHAGELAAKAIAMGRQLKGKKGIQAGIQRGMTKLAAAGAINNGKAFANKDVNFNQNLKLASNKIGR